MPRFHAIFSLTSCAAGLVQTVWIFVSYRCRHHGARGSSGRIARHSSLTSKVIRSRTRSIAVDGRPHREDGSRRIRRRALCPPTANRFQTSRRRRTQTGSKPGPRTSQRSRPSPCSRPRAWTRSRLCLRSANDPTRAARLCTGPRPRATPRPSAHYCVRARRDTRAARSGTPRSISRPPNARPAVSTHSWRDPKQEHRSCERETARDSLPVKSRRIARHHARRCRSYGAGRVRPCERSTASVQKTCPMPITQQNRASAQSSAQPPRARAAWPNRATGARQLSRRTPTFSFVQPHRSRRPRLPCGSARRWRTTRRAFISWRPSAVFTLTLPPPRALGSTHRRRRSQHPPLRSRSTLGCLRRLRLKSPPSRRACLKGAARKPIARATGCMSTRKAAATARSPTLGPPGGGLPVWCCGSRDQARVCLSEARPARRPWAAKFLGACSIHVPARCREVDAVRGREPCGRPPSGFTAGFKGEIAARGRPSDGSTLGGRGG